MTLTEAKLEFTVCEQNKNGIPVIIVAAGSSTRMNGVNKQSALLLGQPVLARTLMNFENSPVISKIIVVTRQEDTLAVQLLAERYGITKLSDIVMGGASRQESVLNGLKMLDETAEYVLIHDGARPLTDEEVIKNVADKLKEYSAVTCAVPLKDTVKRVDESGIIVDTPDRSSLLAVQTPQGVRLKDYLSAIDKIEDVSKFTDDMSIMEAAGFKAVTVLGSYKNIKITTPEDILIAECLLKGEAEE